MGSRREPAGASAAAPADVVKEILEEASRSGGFVSLSWFSSRYGLDARGAARLVDALKSGGLYVEYRPGEGGYYIPADDDLRLAGRLLAGVADVVFLESVESTMDVAWELARQGAPSWTVVVAEVQSRGRGRLGRRWVSEPGGLWFSVVLRTGRPAEDLRAFGVASGASVAESVRMLTGVDAWVKWPNDVMVGDAKVAGLLLETSCADGGCDAVLGCGINVNNPPPSVDRPATSLAVHAGARVPRPQLLRLVVARLKGLMAVFDESGPGPLAEYWASYTRMVGRRVRVSSAGEAFEGEVVGVGEDLSLLVRRGDGSVARVVEGDVELLP